MTLKQWLEYHKDKTLRLELAHRAGTSYGYLEQIRYGHRQATIELCEKLFRASKILTPGALIIPRDQRPDIAKLFDEAA